MAVVQTSKYGPGVGQGFGPVSGTTFAQQMVADPDIAAQGAQAMKLAEQQNMFKQGRLNQILPMLNGGVSGQGGGGQATGQLAARPNFRTNLGPAPVIQGGPIWSEQAIRQNVNANNARIDQGTASNNMDMAGRLAGQGFGARSPLTRALEQMGSQSAMGQKADYGRQFEQQARQTNADFGLRSGEARERQFGNRVQEDLGYGNLENQAFGTLQNALNQQLAAAQSGMNAQTSMKGSLANALLSLV